MKSHDSIGGQVGLAQLAELAAENRPRTLEEFEAAVRELASRGYSDHTVASIVGVSVDLVRRIIGERP